MLALGVLAGLQATAAVHAVVLAVAAGAALAAAAPLADRETVAAAAVPLVQCLMDAAAVPGASQFY